MRYSKEVQDVVTEAIKNGESVQSCQERFGIPISVILKWCNLNVKEQSLSISAVRKYQGEVNNAECYITDKMSKYIKSDISDKEYLGLCDDVSKVLYKLTTEILKKERVDTQYEEPQVKKIKEITTKWLSNPNIKKYEMLNQEFVIKE